MGPEPEIFVLPSDEGARGNNGRGPGTTVNPVNTQFSNLGRLSWPKRNKISTCLNFPPFYIFGMLRPEKFPELFFIKPGKRPRTVFRTCGRKSRGFAQNRPDFRGKNVFECQIKDEEVI